ncbi:MAG: signal recognition particle protein [Firmicutes bacterium]|nr:signal recognition particle protein [Bacillota bacterium]
MAFENLSGKLRDVFKNLRGKGRLTEKDVKAALREVKLALLEADVNFKICKDFISRVSEKAVGTDVLEGLNPAQQVIKIVNDELVELMGTTRANLTYSSKTPTVFMMAGLQGAGKTTTTGKLAAQMKHKGKRPLLAACDVYRPAAIKQLQVVGAAYDIPVFEKGISNPVEIAKEAVEYAKAHGNDVVIVDTAGRLHIDEELMEELVNIKEEVRPQEILLVIDAMTGQDAVNVAQTFNDRLGIDGVIITKMDGDTRGGAALSVRAVTGKPIKFVGMGEKLEDLEPFHPDRMASRILGMGDVLSLIERAQNAYDEKEAMELEKKLKAQEFDLNDFLTQLQQIKKMGPLKDLMKMLPGIGGKIDLDAVNIDDNATKHVEAIIQSMTKQERANPDILNGSRKRRIAKGCGRSIQEVNKLLKQFSDMKKMMKQFGDMTKGGKRKFKFPF